MKNVEIGGEQGFFFFQNTEYFNTHTQGEMGEGFKETNSGAYPKGPE